MGTLRWPQLTDDEMDEFLGRGGVGVLSFSVAADESPYSLPVSYGYDADTEHVHFRLAFPPDSGKEDIVDQPVSFVTYDQTDAGWESVVATGTLEDLTDLPYESSALQERWAVTIPFVDVFEEPPETVTFRPFRLDPETLVGRKEVESHE